ncbi:hypothetical protein DL95DRAFT_472004 [Leptodontidium sp. 2 PMI_412]|nr:hypothetical protein DL95DRAFT_472004 [Leptodontidium sp. 2 PMI_412]
MADPLSALSALGAASQLVEQCFKMTVFLCEVRSKLRGSRELIDMMSKEVEQLTGVLRQIISNQSLQTKTMAGVLETCLSEARGLHNFLRNVIISSKDSRLMRIKKTLMAFRKRGLIEARSESLERWKGLLLLCISEINSTNMYTASRDIHVSVEKSAALINNTSSNVTTLVNTLPAIFTQFTLIEGKLQELTNRMDARSEEAITSARLTRSLESIVQHLMISQQSPILHSHFGSNVLTHFLVPIPRNKTFTRFDDTLKKLKQRYLSGLGSTERILTLTGVACGGKTQAALEFCHRARKEQQFGAIFWVKASSVSALEKSFKAISNKLNVSQSDPMETRIKITMSILKAWPCPWLMVFDNYKGQELTKDLGSYMPNSEQGAYLLTRKPEDLTLAEKSSAIHLPDLQLQDALELLLNRSAVERNDENYEQGLRLVRALEKIPRVIMQVGSYVKKHKVSFAEYYRMLQEQDSRSVAAVVDELKLRDAYQKLGRAKLKGHTSNGSNPSMTT